MEGVEIPLPPTAYSAYRVNAMTAPWQVPEQYLIQHSKGIRIYIFQLSIVMQVSI